VRSERLEVSGNGFLLRSGEGKLMSILGGF